MPPFFSKISFKKNLPPFKLFRIALIFAEKKNIVRLNKFFVEHFHLQCKRSIALIFTEKKSPCKHLVSDKLMANKRTFPGSTIEQIFLVFQINCTI